MARADNFAILGAGSNPIKLNKSFKRQTLSSSSWHCVTLM